MSEEGDICSLPSGKGTGWAMVLLTSASILLLVQRRRPLCQATRPNMKNSPPHTSGIPVTVATVTVTTRRHHVTAPGWWWSHAGLAPVVRPSHSLTAGGRGAFMAPSQQPALSPIGLDPKSSSFYIICQHCMIQWGRQETQKKLCAP